MVSIEQKPVKIIALWAWQRLDGSQRREAGQADCEFEARLDHTVRLCHCNNGAGRMDPQVGAFVALAEDLGSDPRTYTVADNQPQLQLPGL